MFLMVFYPWFEVHFGVNALPSHPGKTGSALKPKIEVLGCLVTLSAQNLQKCFTYYQKFHQSLFPKANLKLKS